MYKPLFLAWMCCVYFYVCVFMYACVRSYFGSNLAQIRFVVNANLCLHRCLKKMRKRKRIGSAVRETPAFTAHCNQKNRRIWVSNP